MDDSISEKKENIYTLKEIASILGISYNYLVNKVVKEGALETINVGRGERPQHRVTQKALENFLVKQSSGEQNTIKAATAELQQIRKSIIIAYITSGENLIHPDDALFFSDVIEDVKKRKGIQGKIKNLDLFINSYGGNLDAAYKIIRLLWHYAENISAVVPIAAKSAATTMCTGTSEIVMTTVAELGPVDPIIENPITKEKIPAKSIKIFLSYASDQARLTADKIDPRIISELGKKIEPLLAGAYFNAINTSKEYLRILLNRYMFKEKKPDGEIENIVENLTEAHSSHAFVIDQSEAKRIGLNARLATPQEEKAIKKLMIFYSQFMQVQGLSKVVGNEFWMIHQKLNTVGGDMNGRI